MTAGFLITDTAVNKTIGEPRGEQIAGALIGSITTTERVQTESLIEESDITLSLHTETTSSNLSDERKENSQQTNQTSLLGDTAGSSERHNVKVSENDGTAANVDSGANAVTAKVL